MSGGKVVKEEVNSNVEFDGGGWKERYLFQPNQKLERIERAVRMLFDVRK